MSSQPLSSIDSLILLGLWALRGCPPSQPVRASGREPGSTPRRFRMPPWRSLLLRPWKALSLPHEGSSGGLCSSRGFSGSQRKLAYGRVGVQRSKRGVGTHLVDEYQAPRIDAADVHAPECPQKLVSFCRPSGSFFRLLRRRPTARQTVASLTITPDTANRNSALWE